MQSSRHATLLLTGILSCLLMVIFTARVLQGKDSGGNLAADTIYARKISGQAELYGKIGKSDSALALYAAAGNIYKAWNEPGRYAHTLNMISKLYINIGKFDKGLNNATVARSVSRACRNLEEEGGSCNYLGLVCMNTGKFDSAVFYFKSALEILGKSKGEKQLYLADAWFNLAVLHFYKEELDEALTDVKKAIEIAGALKGGAEENLAACYATEGDISLQKGDYATARPLYEKTISMWVPKYGEHHQIIGGAYNGMGVLFQQTGNFSKAAIFLGKAATIFETISGPDDPNLATIQLNVAIVQLKTKDLTGALASIRNVVRIFSANPALATSLTQAYDVAGFIFASQNQADSAEFYYKKGIATIMRVNKNSSLICQINTNLGLFYLNHGRFEEAQNCLQGSVDLYRRIAGENRPYMATYYYNLGNLNFARKDFKQALFCLQKAIAYNVVGFTDTLGTSNPAIRNVFDKLTLLYSLEAKSSIYEVKYYRNPDSLQFLKTALANIELATQVADSMRMQNKPEDTRNVIDMHTLPYPAAIEFAYILYHRTGDPAYLDKAFLFSEKSRYASLYSSMKELEARNIGGIPDTLQELDRAVHTNLAKCNGALQDVKLNPKPDLKTVRELEQRQFSLNATADSLKSVFEHHYPSYYHLKYDRKITGIKQVQNGLDENEVLLEYAIADKKLITFIISHYTASMVSSPIDPGFFQSIDRFRNMILHRDGQNGSVAEFTNVAGELYDKLIRRAEPLIRGKSLILIPAGKLGTIPFEALVRADHLLGNKSYKTLPYLVKEHPIGYACSATIYLSTHDMNNHPVNPGILAFAPSFKPGNRMLMAELKDRGSEFVSLEGSIEEVRNIRQQFGGKVFTDTSATKKNFLAYASGYNILHISTHGIMNDINPLESKLVFYQNNDSTDAYLYAYELFNLKLNASMVVLSACNTGFGKIEDGEGIMSLSSGFMYSGVPSVISTLWSVNDRSTASIMKDFYHHLAGKEEKPLALQNAQLDYLNSADNLTAHPFFWAGFMAIGNNSPVLGNNPAAKWSIPVLLLILVLLGGAWMVNRRKRASDDSQ
ncbi:MAG: CHAT domain-containing tetratricopeptide repeat protein [Bacteroidota bacterium]